MTRDELRSDTEPTDEAAQVEPAPKMTPGQADRLRRLIAPYVKAPKGEGGASG